MSRRQLERRRDPAQPQSRADDTGCPILHVDMDAFYASVELRTRPDLIGKPVIVGGLGGRSVVLSATYEARAFGVHSAMPMARARRLCPQATVIPPTPGVYAEASRAVMEIFRSVTPLVEPLSLDEAFLDVGGARRRLGSAAAIGDLIRARVADEQRLPCSVGVASTKFLAKLASGRAKPDGLLVVPRDGVVEFLHPLPVGALWGVGEKTEEALARLGLRTIGDIAHTPEATLARAVGPAAGAALAALAWGRDDRPVVPHEPDRSIGAEETFARDVEDPVVVHRELLRLSERTATRLRKAGHVARTVSIKVRFADFTTITRSKTLADPTDVTRVVYDTAKTLYDALRLDRARIRLVGVRVEGLSDAVRTPQQLAVDGGHEEWRAAERAADQAVARFGAGAVRPAALVDREQRDRDLAAASRDDDTTVW
ncbi:MAG: DNA polymerase IV [Frankiaceae bacterium]|nr:DNA polymerase IV [Frankiaceae bacterium]MBV9369112.1 DNA polymerase IV [Frankiales bacterium]